MTQESPAETTTSPYRRTLVRGDDRDLFDLDDRLAQFDRDGFDLVAITPYSLKRIPGDQSRPAEERGFLDFSRVRWYLCIFRRRADEEPKPRHEYVSEGGNVLIMRD